EANRPRSDDSEVASAPRPTLRRRVPSAEFAYTVRRSDRARRVRVVVAPTGSVEVVLPRRAPQCEAAAAVAELRPWIERRLAETQAARTAVAARGGELPYLGETLRAR